MTEAERYDTAAEILRRKGMGESSSDIASRLGLSVCTITRIAKRAKMNVTHSKFSIWINILRSARAAGTQFTGMDKLLTQLEDMRNYTALQAARPSASDDYTVSEDQENALLQASENLLLYPAAIRLAAVELELATSKAMRLKYLLDDM